MTMGIKEGVADVEVKTVDIETEAVTTEKIASAAVTLAKIDREVGCWHGFHFTTTATTVTTAFRTVLSSACTVLACIVNITTAVTAASTLTVSNTGGDSLVVFAKASAIHTLTSQNLTALATVLAIEVSAGGTVKGVLSNTSDKLIGDVYLLTITTPT